MFFFERELGSPEPREIAVLFIDLQHRWSYGRNRTLLPDIVRFARDLRQTDVRQLWIGHDIGETFAVPKAVSSLKPVEAFQQIRHDDDRFLFDLTAMRGGIIHKQEPNAFTNPLLARKLKEAGITTVLGCGFIAGQCVMETLEGARNAGFQIGYVADRSIDNRLCGGLSAQAVERQKYSPMPMVESHELFAYLQRRQLHRQPRLTLSLPHALDIETHGLSGFRERFALKWPARPALAPADLLAAKAEHLARFLESLKQKLQPARPFSRIALPNLPAFG